MHGDSIFGCQRFTQAGLCQVSKVLCTFIQAMLTVIFSERLLRYTQLAQNVSPLFREVMSHTLQVGDSSFQQTQAYGAVVRISIHVSIQWQLYDQGIIVVQGVDEAPDDLLGLLLVGILLQL